jgi:K+-transporting ATPase KdpF subunit
MQFYIAIIHFDMKTAILLVVPEISFSYGYVIGAVIAIFIFAYLIYSLVKPEKF